ncbi:MAG: phosphomethylpyrimidine synthase ThiC [Solidesulfovibrio sp.]|uniref:phosphomethylpyrimidine synthase ThiC n=1 Tax=Solidesulfovibrio sp. TaxID=2910990 RepID=UPI003157FBEF
MALFHPNPRLESVLDRHLEAMAAAEGLSPDGVAAAVAAGTMTVLANPGHGGVRPTLIGQPAAIKVNANIGTSPLLNDAAMEGEKLRICETAGADTVMDLSTAGDLDAIRRGMLAATFLPLGTVPVYAVANRYIAAEADPAGMTEDEILAEIEKQAAQGVDFMTVHCGVTARAVDLSREEERVTGIVSRGGAILARWMRRNGRENPFYGRFDDILDIARAHNVVLSLGDGLRPGAGADAGDAAQWEEVIELGRLARRARARGVQVMIEGPGHVPLNLVGAHIQCIKRLTAQAPLYVLGPLTTDCAPGYDHIGAAIGGALAGTFGADFLCYVTPAEHLTLPCADDVRQGIMASRIAAQAAETARGRERAVSRNRDMSRARKALDWEAMAELAIDPALVRERRRQFGHQKECAMCGKFCAVRMQDGL